MSAISTRWGLLLGIAIGSAYTLSANCVLAQITPDATLPNNSIVNINGNTFNITGGTQAGTNLFHSFQQFSVPTGSGAFFNTVDIQNIISRVTGGSISNIDGLIRTLGTANLFLINPNGIVFGPNARLEIGGSFFASTASSLKFADGTEFRTDGTQTTPLLTISVPLGLQFGQNPGKIEVQGDGQGRRLTKTDLIDTPNALRLGANQTLGLVGGDLELSGGTLKSTGGRIELGSVGSESLVGLVPIANGWTLDYGGVQNFRDIQLLQGATVDASGIGGGNVRVQGRRITLKQGSQIEASTLGFQSGGTSGGTLEVTGIESIQLDGSGATYSTGIFTGVYEGANGNGGSIILTTGSLSLTDGGQLDTSISGKGQAGNINANVTGALTIAGVNNGVRSGIFSNLGSGAIGKAGNINVTSGSVSLTDGAEVTASTNGQGDAGSILVQAKDSVSAAGNSYILSTVENGGVGKGGDININAATLSLKDGALLEASTFGQGDAGSISVQAKDSVSAAGSGIFSSVENRGVGKGGDVNISTATLSLKDGAQLSTAVRGVSDNQPAGQGQAGNVNVNVTGALTIAGVKNGFSSGIFSNLGRGAIGKAGNINVTSGSVSLTDGARLEAATVGKGDGGNINVTSGSVSLTDGATLEASTFGQGDAGSVSVQANDSVSVADSTIFSNVERGAVGKGGDVNINAATLSLKDGAQLGTGVREASNNQPAGQGQAGNVNVNVTGAVTIAGVKNRFPSGIFSSLRSGAIGKGGNINVTSGSVSLTDGARLEAATAGKGDGGNINVTSGSVSLTDGAEVTASTFGQGDAGSISLQAKDSVSVADSTIFSNVERGGVGKGGDVNINAATLSLKDGAQLGTGVREASNNQPAGQGQAGNVNVNVTGALTIVGVKNGFPSGIFSSLRSGAIGKGGNINVTSGSVSLTDGARLEAATAGKGDAGKIQINATDYVSVSGTSEITNPEAATGLFVRSLSSGAAGDIEVTAPQIRLDNSARFNAESASGNGGNINLQVGDLLLLRRGSFISATAGTDKLGGNGGNITINARSGFIVSAPNENSDITANAFNGSGGKIDINSLGIFNFTQRSREDLVRELGTDNPNELNPQQLPTNDITAFSLTNPTLTGQITINTPDADQSLGLVELPIVLTDTSKFIANTGCDAIASTDSDTDKSKFTNTGRGGLPPSPYEPLSTDVVWLDTRIAEITTQQQRSQGSAAKPPSKADVVKIVPATGWVFDGKGNVTLISNASNANGLASTPAGCAKK